MTDSQIKEVFNNLQSEIKSRRNINFFNFIKQILVLSTTLLGLAVAFHKFVEIHTHNPYLILSISLFGLNILLALIVLHGEIRNLDKSVYLLEKEKKVTLVEKQNSGKIIYVPFDKGVVYGAKILYVSFALSVLSLCLYGILSLQQNKSETTKSEFHKQCYK